MNENVPVWADNHSDAFTYLSSYMLSGLFIFHKTNVKDDWMKYVWLKLWLFKGRVTKGLKASETVLQRVLEMKFKKSHPMNGQTHAVDPTVVFLDIFSAFVRPPCFHLVGRSVFA